MDLFLALSNRPRAISDFGLCDAKKMGGYVFFGYLEKERPGLLDFRAVGSKWQIVHGWLRHGGRLKD
jgi:hypothetical protein